MKVPKETEESGIIFSSEHMKTLGDVQSIVGRLYAELGVDEHQQRVEQGLLQKIESLKLEVAPLERVCSFLTFLSALKTLP